KFEIYGTAKIFVSQEKTMKRLYDIVALRSLQASFGLAMDHFKYQRICFFSGCPWIFSKKMQYYKR
ncbi:MAG: hypothetical protein ABII06_12455, partial [Pseudomonadota bacterium]